MHVDGMVFVLAIIAVTTGGWIVNNWLRMKHGYEPTDRKGRPVSTGAGPDAQRKIELLSTENDRPDFAA